jgi:tetratricopeptide (TPR) repeat protein
MLVIARSTAFQFPSGDFDVRKIGSKLGVRYVAQGAAQLVGGRIRITVGLASTETREELASWQYDRKLDDVLVIQEEIAQLVVSALEAKVLQQEMQRSILIPSSNLDAWSAYHRGLSHMYRFRMKECDSAEYFFRRAIDLESTVPRPYSGLSFVNYERAYLNLEGNRVNFLRRSAEHALQAIDIFARRLSPYDPLIYGMLGVSALSLALMGRHAEAVQRAVKALKHPDAHHQAHAWAVAIFTLAGRLDLADGSLKCVLTANPDYDIQEFFSAHAFQNEDDVQRITWAFQEAKRHYRH